MQQIYRQRDEQLEVYTTVFSPRGETHKHTVSHLLVLQISQTDQDDIAGSVPTLAIHLLKCPWVRH